jgi:hypothetical protein
MSTGLTEQDIQEAAAEAGISPAELKLALAEQHGLVPANADKSAGLVPQSRRGPSAAHAEAPFPWAPELAVRSVKAALEREVNVAGHMQSPTEADLVDPDTGLAYHIRAVPDGGRGALVRIDIDPSPRSGKKALAAVALVGSVVVLGIGGLFSWPWLAAAAGVGVVGGLMMRGLGRRGVGPARGIAASALLDAEAAGPPPQAFPPEVPPGAVPPPGYPGSPYG